MVKISRNFLFVIVHVVFATVWISFRCGYRCARCNWMSRRVNEDQGCCKSNSVQEGVKCEIAISDYVSSSWERSWIQNISHWKSDDREWTTGCKQMRKDKEYLNFFQSFSSDPLRLGNHTRTVNGKEHERLRQVFSYHRAYDSCSKEEYFLYIEPLVSFLRHPGAVCFSNNPQDKSYIILPSALNIISKGAKKYFFDVGASTYIAGLGGDSQKWFVDNYRLQGIEFDHIFGWEAKPTRPSKQWNSVPPDIKRKSSWYNIPASSEKGHPDNPWTFVREIANKEDFIVVKIDIDTPKVEIELVMQLLEDPVLLSLVDEFYFEHHVHGNPMQFRGWGNLRRKNENVPHPGIEHSYKIFQILREKGVRAHSWV